MTYYRPFSFFRTKGTPLPAMVRPVCSRAMLIGVVWASSMALQPHQASAMQAAQAGNPNPKAASLEAVEHCAGPTCTAFGLLVDPDSPAVSSIHLELTFDPTLYSFDASGSGPLCAFAAGGSPCPPPRARLETSLIRVHHTRPGVSPKGARLSFTVEPVKDSQVASERKLLIVDYTLPRAVDVSRHQNVLYLSFNLVTPVTKRVPLVVKYFETLGDHQFNQVAFECNGKASYCRGELEIRGLDVSRRNSKPPP
jgi:hypothetical protein